MKEIVPMEIIERKILLLRGQKVILDRDLAALYDVETRVLNQAVRRNIERFPADFMISLTRKEIMNLSQFVISSGIKHAPNVFAFTEQGVAMLSGVLNSRWAVQVNISFSNRAKQGRPNCTACPCGRAAEVREDRTTDDGTGGKSIRSRPALPTGPG